MEQLKVQSQTGCKGCEEKKNFDYFNIYTPVARISEIKLLIWMIAIKNMIIHQMDGKTALGPSSKH